MWLNRLLDTMQSTIRHEMTEAVISYEEKPRDQWLFEPPAQVSQKKNRASMLIVMSSWVAFSVVHSIGCSFWYPNLVDHRSEHSICETRRRLRKCSQRLLQETSKIVTFFVEDCYMMQNVLSRLLS